MQLTRSRPEAPSPSDNGTAPGPTRRDRGGLRRGLVLTGRVVLWSAILLLAVRGGAGILTELRAAPDAAPGVPAGVDEGFPSQAARAFATRFAHDYLTYDADARSRPDRLSDYVPGGEPGQFGWDGVGEQTVGAVVATDVTVLDRARASVLVAARVDGPRWLHLSVPVVADDAGRLAVAGSPTFVAAPRLASVPTEPELLVDSALSRELTPVLESFFEAYAEGRAEDLAYYLAVGRVVEGLGGTVELDELVDLEVAEGRDGDDARDARATVRWNDPVTGAALTQRYDLRLVDGGGRWYVDGLGTGGAPLDEHNDSRRTR